MRSPLKCVLLYHESYNGRGFSPLRDSWKRYPRFLTLAHELRLHDWGLRAVNAVPATDDLLSLVHPQRYIAWVREQEAAGDRFFDRSTPAWPGVFARACASVGATVGAARLIGQGQARTAFNPSGGLHHAHAERASGFCIFNDVVVGTRVLQREFGLQRIAIVDIDGHHGDGTQALLYEEPILYISLHRYGDRFYPSTGSIAEQGMGAGWGYTINVPLPRRCGDRAFLLAMRAIVEPALLAYRPECIILQYGTDGHHADAMVRLGLTTQAFAESARLIRQLADHLCEGRLLAVGGGGYRPEDAIRCWSFLAGELTDTPGSALAHLHDEPPYPEEAPEAEAWVRRAIGAAQACGALRERALARGP